MKPLFPYEALQIKISLSPRERGCEVHCMLFPFSLLLPQGECVMAVAGC